MKWDDPVQIQNVENNRLATGIKINYHSTVTDLRLSWHLIWRYNTV